MEYGTKSKNHPENGFADFVPKYQHSGPTTYKATQKGHQV
jgi:hypothetical protein